VNVASNGGAAAAGLLLDRAFGEPPSAVHPVAWFGSTMGAVERRIWGDTRAHGVAYTGIGITIGAVAGRLVGRSVGSTVAATAMSVAGRELRTVATRIATLLAVGDLAAARAALPSLVGRDPNGLDESGVAAAVIESLAENTVDAVFAPALWAAGGGAVGTLTYRAINTMDAMVGHHSLRYERFGWAAARLDDCANFVPARVFAATVLAIAPHRAPHIARAVRRDAPRHPSPNAGVAEAAVAGALGLELGGPLRYGDRQERRPALGSGPRPRSIDIDRAVRLVDRAECVLAAGLAGLCLAIRSSKNATVRA
jgi:adenosylcobinamide-phosphate synthase